MAAAALRPMAVSVGAVWAVDVTVATRVQELWHLSEAERVRVAAGESGFALRKQAQAQGFRTVGDDAQAKGLVL